MEVYYKARTDYLIGRHSNFPRCCIWWFCLVWSHLGLETRRADDPIRDWILRNIYWPLERRRGEEVQYVQCPVCLIRGHAVEIHECVPNQDECFWSKF